MASASQGNHRSHETSGVPRREWLVAPLYDLLFLANVGWLLAWLPILLPADRIPAIQFWQVYFLTTPHRWLTLFLVALDPDRREGRVWPFVLTVVITVLIVTLVRGIGGGFICLLLVDYLWNAWHFAAQHSGVLRMYARKAGDAYSAFERWGLRIAVFYVSVRLAGWSSGWAEYLPMTRFALAMLDVVVLCPMAGLVWAERARRPTIRAGKLVYLVSVGGLYSSLLCSLYLANPILTASLATAASMFHAVEYLAVVTKYAHRRQHQGTRGLFSRVVTEWTLVLSAYLVAVGLVACLLDRLAQDVWLGMNLSVAFMHYAFDGMIWKLRSPRTEQLLGLPSNSTSRAGVAGHSSPFAPAGPVTVAQPA